ncbi:hypothetical protein HPS174_1457 [Glaesserella parasuis 174]|nr:hypothetical protein HPS174_1457 [Glaesserella parasuis 174]
MPTQSVGAIGLGIVTRMGENTASAVVEFLELKQGRNAAV